MSGHSTFSLSSTIATIQARTAYFLSSIAQPERVRRLRWGLALLAVVWALIACSQLIWALLPAPASTLPADLVILNPAQGVISNAQRVPIDINKMVSWHLLGEAKDIDSTDQVIETQEQQTTGREGIEDGARETSLDLRLRGIVASTEDGLGHAVIEYKSKQQLYAVEDKLPISGRVILAKVMRDRVVIDNRGTYELLILFEGNDLVAQIADSGALGAPRNTSKNSAVRVIDKRRDTKATALAQNYRQQLYQNPQSLADLVRISAVRDEGGLRGYRVMPGSDSTQFKQLGFQNGDVVTSVNGIALNDPGNTVRLYQLMRSATEAVFDLERKGEQLTVSVSLDDAASEQ